MPRRLQLTLVLACVVAMAAGCGSSKRVTASSVASCLNGRSFLVIPTRSRVEGASPGGITFTLTLYKTPEAARQAGAALSEKTTLLVGRAIVDFRGNAPVDGHAPKLATADANVLAKCLGTQPATGS